MPDKDCPECRGTGVVNLGDDCDYHCPVCVGARRIRQAPDGAIVIDRHLTRTAAPLDPPADSEGGEQ